MIVVTFHSVSSALYLEKLLGERQITCVVIPVPRELSSSCGYALEANTTDAAALTNFMNEHDVEWENMYRREGGFTLIGQATETI